MTLARVCAGAAAMITAMLLQATVVGPLAWPLPVSLPLVVLGAIAVLTGPATGITLGFTAGLLADLGSDHPAGVLALTWLGAGVAAGVLGGLVTPVEIRHNPGSPYPQRPVRRGSGARRGSGLRRAGHRRGQALVVASVAAPAGAATALLLAVLHRDAGPLAQQLVQCVPAAGIEAILALPVLALAGAMLRSGTLRPPQPAAATRPLALHLPAEHYPAEHFPADRS